MYGRLRIPFAMILLMCGDVLAVCGALALSLMLRFDGMPLSQIYHEYLRQHLTSLPVTAILYVSVFAAFRLYRCAWRFASLEILWGVIFASSAGLLGSIVVQYAVDGSILPRSVLIIFWLLSILFVGGVRVLLRLASLSQHFGSRAVSILKRDLRPRRIVILGGGSNGVQVLNGLRDDHGPAYDVVGFLDDNPNKHGLYIRDVRVLGPVSELYKLLDARAVDEVLIALPEAAGDEIREYVMACRKQKVIVKVIPALREMLNGKGMPRIEEISVEDLLRRVPAKIDRAEIGKFLRGKRVMVTGAGGSIGSELCRQILALNPATLVLLGHGENSIHRIWQELCHRYSEQADSVRVVIASVADEVRMNQVIHEHRPQVVFHAAAHKHVPIMEENVLEAVLNNVIGTSCVAEACGRARVECMVLISTDKAVYPASVMGATKWLCERILRAMVGQYRDTNYVTVRFGNVLGSRGSVVPIFHDQISRGGPVTVTHPEMTRYFMIIPEAVKLVLEAGAVGRPGELYLLDMGKPVRIVDMAHDMIRLCGYEPDVDIPVVFTGPRPGEKLHESLVGDGEMIEPAFGEGMSIVRCPESFSPAEVIDIVRQCRQLVNRGDSSEMYDYLTQIIPELSTQTLIGRPS